MQRKNRSSTARQQPVFKVCTEHSDEANNVTVNSSASSAGDDKPIVNKVDDSSMYGDHLYCKTEIHIAPSNQSVEPELTESNMNIELTKPLSFESSTCVKTDSELFDELSESLSSALADSSLSDDACKSESTLPYCCSAETTPSLDAVLTLRETSELDISDPEDMTLNSSVTSDVGTITDSKSDRPATDGVSCEVVDLSDGRCVELECQCGAHYSDPTDKLHVVECQRCQSHQHATCVNYDLTDSLRGLYLCPHCRVVEVCPALNIIFVFL